MGAASPAQPEKRARYWQNRHRAGVYFIAPALLFYLIFFVNPFISTFYYSLTDWNGFSPTKNFIGLSNYVRMAGDQLLWLALSHNITWIIIGTIAPIAIALPLSVMLYGTGRGRLVFQTTYFMPHILSGVVIAMIWGWIYNPLFGLLNSLLGAVGLEQLQRAWLGNPSTALYSVIAAAVWGYFGFCVVIFMAGLQNLDITLIEAAKIDGANAWQRFWHVIVPQLRYVLNMVIVYTLIGGFNVFDLVHVMTRGGPANHTELIGTYTYKMSFQENQIGYGSTLALLMLVLSLTASLLYSYLRDRKEA
jgi:raffinose/stachyose/melibiose transport system permease protein